MTLLRGWVSVPPRNVISGRFTFWAACLAVAVACAFASAAGYPQTVPSRSGPAGASAEYRIGTGDVLQVFVWKEPDLSRELTVRADGRVTVPLVGEMQAAGRTPPELAQEMTKRLEKYINTPEVTVGVLRANAARFFVLGQVERPGEFPLNGRTTVLQALAMAGGFRDYAKTDGILIVRLEEGPSGDQLVQRVVPFNYKRLEDSKDTSQNVLVQAGDTILVP